MPRIDSVRFILAKSSSISVPKKDFRWAPYVKSEEVDDVLLSSWKFVINDPTFYLRVLQIDNIARLVAGLSEGNGR